MELLIKTEFFKNLNIGFALDEGLANPGEEYMLYYSERLPWWIEVTVTGQPGHGSQLRFYKKNRNFTTTPISPPHLTASRKFKNINR